MPRHSLFPILLVDDNADDLFVLRQRVLRSGVKNPVLTFEDGEDAMAYLRNLRPGDSAPCVMFLDVRMPATGGFEVLKWVREQPSLAALPVVIITTSALPEDAARARKFGATRFLKKFPTPEEFATVIAEVTGGAPGDS